MSYQIIPAILPRDYNEVVEKTDMVAGLAKIVQIDICDGQFVPNATWPYKKHDDNFERLISEAEGLPHWQVIDYEFDLMMNYTEETDIQNWINAGAERLIIHVESKGDLHRMIQVASTVDVSLALSEETPIDRLDEFLNKYENIKDVQLMGIDNIGFQGQKFDARVIDKIRAVKERFPDIKITIDGGVSLENAQTLLDAGADRLVVGSQIFNSDNIVETYHQFASII
jgi:ribulose-phosphate 3-epimerase